MMEESGLEDLSVRRERLTDNFARKAASSERYSDWFPLNSNRTSSRVGNKYEEKTRRLERTRSNPLDHMRRRLNMMSMKER